MFCLLLSGCSKEEVLEKYNAVVEKVGENTFIGAGATVIQQRQIGNEAIVGAGCTIKRNIGNQCVCKGTDNALTSVQMEES